MATRRLPLLDLGNVLVQVDFTPFLDWLAELSGETREGVRGLLSSSLFYDLEFGQIGPAEFARRLRALYHAEFTEAELGERFCGIFPGLVPGMGEELAALKKAGPVYCLTSTNAIHLEYVRGRFPELALFDRVFASHELKKRKPYPGVYVAVAEELRVEPGELVFFDDSPANVEGALRAGLEAHVFRGAADFAARLKAPENLDDNDD